MICLIFDLHIHSNFSDGKLSPIEIIDHAISIGLDGIALTDHDTVDGLDIGIKYGQENNKLKVIPGIEFSCDYPNEEVHILGYFIDYKNPNLSEVINKLKTSRKKRIVKIIVELNKIGLKIDLSDIGDKLGRLHIAQALERLGHVKSTQEAFNLYLAKGRPAYVSRFKLNIEDTIDLIHDTGGKAVMAHLGLLSSLQPLFYAIDKGLDGIEVVHSKHKTIETKKFFQLAYNNKLIVTGGSDCHGKIINNRMLMGKYTIDIGRGNNKIDLF